MNHEPADEQGEQRRAGDDLDEDEPVQRGRDLARRDGDHDGVALGRVGCGTRIHPAVA